MEEYNNDDFKELDNIIKNITPPPLFNVGMSSPIIGSIQTSPYYDIVWYNGRYIKCFSTTERYSISHIQRVLYEKYEYCLEDITEYKGTRYGNHWKTYRIYDTYGNIIVEKCNLNQIAAFLMEQGDY